MIAQEKKEGEEQFKGEELVFHHSVAIVIGYATVFKGRDENGKRKTLSLPLWGIDYNYHFSHRWALGLHTDIITENFEAEKEGGEEIERNHPVVPVILTTFTPVPHWGFLIGPGMEYEEKESFFLVRAGIEYSGELPKEWEVFGSLGYDFKWDAYDTWTIGIGIAKFFGKDTHKK